jgi:hypothetical protein
MRASTAGAISRSATGGKLHRQAERDTLARAARRAHRTATAYACLYSWIAHVFPSGSSKKQ